MYILYFVIAVLATGIGAVTGMGGGIIIKPVMDMLNHYDVSSISMLSSITVFVMAAVSLAQQFNSAEKRESPVTVLLALGSVAGGYLGNILLSRLISVVVDPSYIVLWQNLMLACLLVVVIVYMHKKNDVPSLRLKGFIPFVSVGLLLGLISSFLGIGGGPINVAIIIFVFSYPIKAAAHCSLLIILFSQASKLITDAFSGGFGNYDLSVLPVMVMGGIVGGIIGSIVFKRADEKTTSRLFNIAQAIVLLLCVINIFRNLRGVV